MIKYLITAAILYAMYFVFFKKKNTIEEKKKKRKDDSADTLSCHKCSTYVSVDDALMVDGKYYCSKECINS